LPCVSDTARSERCSAAPQGLHHISVHAFGRYGSLYSLASSESAPNDVRDNQELVLDDRHVEDSVRCM